MLINGNLHVKYSFATNSVFSVQDYGMYKTSNPNCSRVPVGFVLENLSSGRVRGVGQFYF